MLDVLHVVSSQSDIVVRLAEYDSTMNFKVKKSFKGFLVKILSDVGTNLRLHDPLVFIEACQTTNAWQSFNQFSLA